MKTKDFSLITTRLETAIADTTHSDGTDAAVRHLRSVQQQIDAIGRGDLDGAIANAQPDVRLEIHAPPEFHWIRQAVGVGALRDALAHNFGSMEEQHPEITTLTAQGDTVILIGREHGRIKATGTPYRVQFVERFLFREGRLASITVIAAHETA
jgi:ketosteroid isomerase-like protein